MGKISHEEWIKEGESLFGKDKKNWKFKCPNCGNIQSYHDFKEKTSIKEENIEGVVYFSCIGRWIKDSEGTITNKSSPCNYTNGGLFDFSKVRVIDKEGKEHSAFEFDKTKDTKRGK